MAEVIRTNIDVAINTSKASAELKKLQTQINAFNLTLNRGSVDQLDASKRWASGLSDVVNNTKFFRAETVRLQTSAGALDSVLKRGSATMGQFFSAAFNKRGTMFAETTALASERVRTLQTQFVATSKASGGMQEALAIRPLAAFSSQASIAAQRMTILSAMFKQGTTNLINFGKNIQWAGRQLMVGFTVPLTIFGTAATRVFRDLEKEVVNFKKVYGDLFTTDLEVETNLNAVKELSKEFTKYGIAAKETMMLAAIGAQAGKEGAELQAATIQATRLSVLGDIDRQTAMKTTIALQSAFKLSNEELANSINFLNLVENSSVVSLQNLTDAIPRVAPIIVGLGGDIKDMAVFLAAMQEGGVNAAEAANGLKSSLGRLISPTKQARDMANEFGISLENIVKQNEGNVLQMVISLSESMKQLTDLQKQQLLSAVFGKFQFARMGALFENITREGSQASRIIEMMDTSIEDLAATADKELSAIEDSIGTQLTAAIEKLKLELAPVGELFAKMAIPLLNFAVKLLESFNSISDSRKTMLAWVAMIVGIAVPALTMFFGLIMNLIGNMAKFGQLLLGFAVNFARKGPIGAIRSLTQSTKYLSLAEIDAANAARQLGSATEITNAALLKQVGAGTSATAAINALTASYRLLAAEQARAVATQPALFATGRSIVGKSLPIVKRNKGGEIFTLNQGNRVPGVGNTDTVPAMLTPGEFVVNKESTQNNLDVLKAINSGTPMNLGGQMKGGILHAMAGAIASSFGAKRVSTFIGAQTGAFKGRGAAQRSRATQLAQRGVNLPSSSLGVVERKNNYVYGFQPALNQQLTGTVQKGFQKIGVSPNKIKQSMLSKDGLYFIDKFAGKAGWNEKGYKNAIEKSINDIVSINRGKEVRFLDQKALNRLIESGKIQDFPNIKFVSTKDIHTKSVLDTLSKDHLTRLNTISVETQTSSMRGRSKQYTLGTKKFTSLDDLIIQQEKLKYKEGTTVRVGTEQSGGSYYTLTKGSWQEKGRILPRSQDKKIQGLTQFEPGVPGSYASLNSKNHGRPKGIHASHVFNKGNIVPGVGNTDTVPAMLTPGEFVINKKSTQENYDLLTAINDGMNVGGKVKKFNDGGMAKGVQFFQEGGTAARLKGGVSMAAMGALFLPMMAEPMKNSSNAMTKSMGEFVEKNQGVIFGLAILAPVLMGLGLKLGLLVAGVAAMGALAFKLVGNLKEMRNSSSNFIKAMYGSAEITKKFAEEFNRQTVSQRLATRQAEIAGGAIAEEVREGAAQFIKTDLGKELIKEMQTVAAAGGDVAEALRNQLARQVLAEVMTPEEARAIAAQVGAALGDETISFKASAQITKLFGTDGKAIDKNIGDIIAEISPKIDEDLLRMQAENAFEKSTSGIGKLLKPFLSREAEVYKIQLKGMAQAALETAEIEKQARASITLALQENTITAQQYLLKLKEIEGAKFGTGLKTFFEFAGIPDSLNALESANKELEKFESNWMIPASGNQDVNLFDKDKPRIDETAIRETLGVYGKVLDKNILDMLEALGLESYQKTLNTQINSIFQNFKGVDKDIKILEFKDLIAQGEIGIDFLAKFVNITEDNLKEIRQRFQAYGTDLQTYLTTLQRIPDSTTKDAIINMALESGGRVLTEQELEKVTNDVLKITELPQEIRTALNIDMTDFDEIDRIANLAPEIQKQFDEVSKFIKTTKKDISDKKVQMEIIAKFTNLENSYIEKIMNSIGSELDPVKLPILISIMADPNQLALLEDAMRGGAPGSMQQFAAEFARKKLGPLFDILKASSGSGEGSDTSDDNGEKQKTRLQEFRESFKETMKTAKDFYKVLASGKGAFDTENASLLMANGLLDVNAKQRQKVINEIKKMNSVQAALAFLQKSAEERAIEELEKRKNGIQKQVNVLNDALSAKQRQNEIDQRQISIRQRGLELISRQEQKVSEVYDKRIEALNKVEKVNDRIARQQQSQISLASAIASGDFGAAASAASQMQSEFAQSQMEDTRTALEAQKQRELESITASINGQKFTRAQIEQQIQDIGDRIYERELSMLPIQDQIFQKSELIRGVNEQIDLIKDQIKIKEEEEIQRGLDIIENLGKKNKRAKGFNDKLDLSNALAGELNKTLGMPINKIVTITYIGGGKTPSGGAFGGFTQDFAMGGSVNKYPMGGLIPYMMGGSVKKYGMGGMIGFRGSREAPPPVKMAFGSIAPGLGNTDRVPALLTPGEFVVRKSVAKENMGLLKALNGDVFPQVGRSIDTDSISSITSISTVGGTNLYNNNYSVNVNVSGTDESASDIANIVVRKLKTMNDRNIRGSRF